MVSNVSFVSFVLFHWVKKTWRAVTSSSARCCWRSVCPVCRCPWRSWDRRRKKASFIRFLVCLQVYIELNTIEHMLCWWNMMKGCWTVSIVHRWQRVDVDSIEFLSGSSGCFESSSANRQSRAEPNDEMTSSTSSSSPCFFAFFLHLCCRGFFSESMSLPHFWNSQGVFESTTAGLVQVR